MSRHRGTTASGKLFDAATIEAVWEKARISKRHTPLRLDALGSLIWKPAHGSTHSKFGWEIDHIKPVAAGGGDELENLQPLQWENNRDKGNAFEGPANGSLPIAPVEQEAPAEVGEAALG
jgi:5-methylcytosine-specific restriction endonuclease McrA